MCRLLAPGYSKSPFVSFSWPASAAGTALAGRPEASCMVFALPSVSDALPKVFELIWLACFLVPPFAS